MRSKRELVTAFVAVLEIARTEGIRLTQSSTFADIILRTS
jgi:chromatin segregation and condensation protein Rec8/ScpA/Scc1 (kleisin family)